MGARMAAPTQQISTTVGARCVWPDSQPAETKTAVAAQRRIRHQLMAIRAIHCQKVALRMLAWAVTTLRRPLGRICPDSGTAHPPGVPAVAAATTGTPVAKSRSACFHSIYTIAGLAILLICIFSQSWVSFGFLWIASGSRAILTRPFSWLWNLCSIISHFQIHHQNSLRFERGDWNFHHFPPSMFPINGPTRQSIAIVTDTADATIPSTQDKFLLD